MSGARLEARVEAQTVAMNNSNKPGSRSIRSWLIAVLAAALVAACGQDDVDTPTGNPDDVVDPALVGFWDLPVPGGRWTLEIESYGHYEFSNVSGSAAPSHQGSFAARSGKWKLSSVTGIEDAGSYKVLDDGIELAGNLGAVRWARGVPITGVTPGADASANVAQPQRSAFGAAGAQQPALGAGAQQPVFNPNVRPALADTNPPPRQTTAPRPPAAAARTSSFNVPDTVDPCLLVTADEAAKLLGATVATKRTTPQPLTQNDCLYSAQGRTFQVTTFNGKGLDANGFMQRRRESGGVPLPDVGDDAVITQRDRTGLVSVSFVIGAASAELLVSGVAADRADPAMRSLAVQAAQRMTSPAAKYDMGGVDRFVGAWRVETHPPKGGSLPDSIIVVQRNGDLEIESSATLSGTLEIAGDAWHLENGLYENAPQGTYRVRGDNLALGGFIAGQLQRVACGNAPKVVRPSYELARTLEGSLRSTTRLAANVRPPASKTLDEKLVGLWEGEGTLVDGTAAKMLVSVDTRGYAVLALFPHGKGRLEANDGEFTIHLEGAPSSHGTYELAGGIRDGTIRMQEGENALVWNPTDPSKRPVYETPIVAHCN